MSIYWNPLNSELIVCSSKYVKWYKFSGSGAPPPSRKREQAEALENLRKKISPALLRKDYGGTLGT